MFPSTKVVGGKVPVSPIAGKRVGSLVPHPFLALFKVKVLHTLHPFAVVMAGSGEFDPFKD